MKTLSPKYMVAETTGDKQQAKLRSVSKKLLPCIRFILMVLVTLQKWPLGIRLCIR